MAASITDNIFQLFVVVVRSSGFTGAYSYKKGRRRCEVKLGDVMALWIPCQQDAIPSTIFGRVMMVPIEM
jgi:hypothetical protein